MPNKLVRELRVHSTFDSRKSSKLISTLVNNSRENITSGPIPLHWAHTMNALKASMHKSRANVQELSANTDINSIKMIVKDELVKQ